MDKKLKRTIGYVPGKVIPVKKDITTNTVPEIIPHEEKANEVAEINVADIIALELGKVKKIITWIKDHPEFKWGVMCKKLGIDKGNFQRVLKSDEPKVKIELIGKIEDFLKEYGYVR